MHEHTSPASVRADYLARLQNAVRDLPHGLASDLTAEITAELEGLNDDALARHIVTLGAPEAVAQAAFEAAQLDTPPDTPPGTLREAPVAALPTDPFGAQAIPHLNAHPRPLNETRGYAIAAVVMLGIGGIVLPAVGWVIGAALVATSKLWRTREKLWGILFTPVMLALILAAYVSITALQGDTPAASAAGIVTEAGFHDPSMEDFTSNPLMPALFDAVWSAVFLAGFVLAPLSALWLLLRLRGRRAPEDLTLA